MRISDWSSDVCSSDLLAYGGRKVIGVDIDAKTVATINRGEIHIVEPFLDALVSRVVADGFPKATSTPEPADAFLIAVPTPFKEDHEDRKSTRLNSSH